MCADQRADSMLMTQLTERFEHVEHVPGLASVLKLVHEEHVRGQDHPLLCHALELDDDAMMLFFSLIIVD